MERKGRLCYHVGMKRLLAFVIVGAIGYFGYRFYVTRGAGSLNLPHTPQVEFPVIVRQPETKSAGVLNVLGATTSRWIEKGASLLNNATDGRAEPVINKAVSDLQDRVKDLPKEEYKKVKYEFCKDVFPSPLASPSPESF